MKLKLVYIIIIALALTGCQTPQNQPAAANAKRFELKGKVISVDKEKKTASIAHEEIPDYMPAMTMDFNIKEDWVMNELTAGSEIRAQLVVDKGEHHLENIGIVALPRPDQTPLPVTNAKGSIEGAELPDFKLTNQDGKRISLKQFRGKALGLTFIYTRCPLPDVCPLLSIRFSDLAKDLQQAPEYKDKVRLLSITFDPKYDTPDVLKKYGMGYFGKDAKPDFELWQLATGSEKEINDVADFFALRYSADENNKEVINHSVRTVLISPDGKVAKVFTDNKWQPAQITNELKKLADLTPAK
jgi:protein SCO1/2